VCRTDGIQLQSTCPCAFREEGIYVSVADHHDVGAPVVIYVCAKPRVAAGDISSFTSYVVAVVTGFRLKKAQSPIRAVQVGGNGLSHDPIETLYLDAVSA